MVDEIKPRSWWKSINASSTNKSQQIQRIMETIMDQCFEKSLLVYTFHIFGYLPSHSLLLLQFLNECFSFFSRYIGRFYRIYYCNCYFFINVFHLLMSKYIGRFDNIFIIALLPGKIYSFVGTGFPRQIM